MSLLYASNYLYIVIFFTSMFFTTNVRPIMLYAMERCVLKSQDKNNHLVVEMIIA